MVYKFFTIEVKNVKKILHERVIKKNLYSNNVQENRNMLTFLYVKIYIFIISVDCYVLNMNLTFFNVVSWDSPHALQRPRALPLSMQLA